MTLAQWVSKNNASSWITPNTKKGTGLANHLLLEKLISYEYYKETESAADFADLATLAYIHKSMTKTEMAESATWIVSTIPHKYGFDCASHSMELIFMMKSLGIPAYQRNDRTYNWSSGYNHQNVVCFPEGTNDTDQFYLAEADGVFGFSKIGAWDFYTGKDKDDQTPGTAMITRYNGVKTRNLVVPKTVKDNRNEEFTVTELGQYIDLAGDEVVSELLSNVTDPDAVRCESLQMPDTVKYLQPDFFGDYVNPYKTISVTGMTGLKGAYIYQFGAKIDQVNFFTTSTTDKYVNLIPKESGESYINCAPTGPIKFEDGTKIADGPVRNDSVNSAKSNTYVYLPEGVEKSTSRISGSDHLHARSPSDPDLGVYIPASVTELEECAFYNTKVIYGIAGSYAEKWAKEIAMSPTLPVGDEDYYVYSTWRQTPKKFIPVENVKVNYDDYSRTWDIVKIDISTCTVTANPTSFTYNGSAQKPAITVKDGSETLKEGVDYTTSGNATNAGSYTITVTGINAYKGTVSKSFTINKANQNFTVTASKPSLTNGESGKLTVSNYRGNLSYTSSNPSVVSVDASGNYKAEGIGSATLTVTASGDSNYASTSKTVTVAVGKININNAEITSAYTSRDFNPLGEYNQPRVTVTYNGTVLTKSTDYTVAYEAKEYNRNAGQHRYQVTGVGNFEGSYMGYYTINALSLSDAGISMKLGASSYNYDGKTKTPAVTLTYTGEDGSATLVKDTDYTVSYTNNTNAGTATVTVSGKGNYTGSKTANFAIELPDGKIDINTATITSAYTSGDFNPLAEYRQPKITIIYDGATLTRYTDYTLSYESKDVNRNAGQHRYKITGIGAYMGTYTGYYTINPLALSSAGIAMKLGATSYTYDGKAKTPAVTLTYTSEDGSVTLVKNTDYTVSYSNNINAGTATVTVTGKGNYKGSKSTTFKIAKAGQTITAANIVKTYATKAQTFAIGAKCNGGAKLTYNSDNKSVTVDSAGKVTIKAKFIGKATITINAAATGNYNAATKKITVTCNPTKAALSSVSSKKKGKMVVKWKKNTVGSGYLIGSVCYSFLHLLRANLLSVSCSLTVRTGGV